MSFFALPTHRHHRFRRAPALPTAAAHAGGRSRLGAISCRGDSYLRTLLIQGARSSLQRAQAVSREKATAEQLWIQSLSTRLPFGKLLVAIANKHEKLIHRTDQKDSTPERRGRHRSSVSPMPGDQPVHVGGGRIVSQALSGSV